MSRHNWSAIEDNFIKANINSLKLRELAEQMLFLTGIKRTESQLRARATRLGVELKKREYRVVYEKITPINPE